MNATIEFYMNSMVVCCSQVYITNIPLSDVRLYEVTMQKRVIFKLLFSFYMKVRYLAVFLGGIKFSRRRHRSRPRSGSSLDRACLDLAALSYRIPQYPRPIDHIYFNTWSCSKVVFNSFLRCTRDCMYGGGVTSYPC